jgi:hypothetical protein
VDPLADPWVFPERGPWQVPCDPLVRFPGGSPGAFFEEVPWRSLQAEYSGGVPWDVPTWWSPWGFPGLVLGEG